MASSSSSSVVKSFTYDVFLSFRGEDTRNKFVDHLYHALENSGIITYKDENKMERGEEIRDQLMRSIEYSRFFIIVFSKNYASSSWCLNELVKIMECQKTTEQTAYPVFYDVEPTEIRKQSGAFGEAFSEHVGKDDEAKWRKALNEAADLAGWEWKTTPDGREATFIQKIVKDVLIKRDFINWSVDQKLVDVEARVEEVVSSLTLESDDVRMIGIKGMGGVGKTTLARAVFERICIQFEGKSFVENVREVSESSKSGLKKLQKQVLKDLLHDQTIDVTSVFDGKNMIERIMRSRKVLLILDDVNHIGQLQALAGSTNWFKQGSRIIITTRDKHVLEEHQVHSDNIHIVKLLLQKEAICLFCRHAFMSDVPKQGYEELSQKVVHYAGGLPLAIKVLGSNLCGLTQGEWEDFIQRLKTNPPKETLEILELSYVGLEEDHKKIFLDIACMLKGERKEKAIRILESCGLHPVYGLKVLEHKSLITISDTACLRMHDRIEDMGKDIVRRVDHDEPKRHSRLWNKEEIEEILENELGTEATQSIKLEYSDLDPTIIMNGLKQMKGLRFLFVDSGNYERKKDEVGQYLPNTLRSLHWPGYPFRCLPKTFKANMLVNLEMPRSNVSQLWEDEERKVPNKLKLRFLDLKYSKLRTFDLGLTPHLEMLNLKECNAFVKLNMRVKCPNLRFINLNGSKVSNFNLELTPNIESLDLGGCNEFVELQMPVECPKLKFLNLSGSKVSNLNLGRTTCLESLDLNQCFCLQEIHAPVGCLEKLVFLNLSGCLRFDDFLVIKKYKLHGGDSLAKLQLIATSVDKCPLHPDNNFPKFKFKCVYDEPLPTSRGNLEKLISFGLCVCTTLESFSASICGLRSLRVLTLEGPEAPKDFYQLESLVELSLSIKEIKNIPDSICILKHLKSLKLKSCRQLEQLPTDLGRLQCLQELHITDCVSLQDIPNSICEIKSLEYLHLAYCSLIEKLPEELVNLKGLKELNIEGTGISRLPQNIDQMKGLCIVWSRVQLELHGFTSLRDISRYTTSCYISRE